MKNLFYKLTVITLILMTSCESFIDLQPLDKISMNDYWKSSTDLKNYMLQFYPRFHPYTEMITQTEIHSDDMTSQAISTVLTGERVKASGNWSNEWKDIRDINIFLTNYKKCTESAVSYSQYVGEAYFFRAWFYFNLVKKYGDVPWYSKPLSVDDEAELQLPRTSRTIIVDSILVDLDKAVTFLQTKSQVKNTKINKEAALAFKTRVALFEGTWQKYHSADVFGTPGANPSKYFQACVDAASALMNGANYSKGIFNTGKPESDYLTLFGLDDMTTNPEILLCRQFNYADGAGNNTQNYLTGEPTGKGATWSLVTSYLGKDGKPYDYSALALTTKGNAFLTKIATDSDPRLHASIFAPGDLISNSLNKYFTKPPIDVGANMINPTGFMVKKSTNPYSINAGLQFGTKGNTGLIILRYGEVLLNYAEALYELNGTIAHTQLNLLRSRAGMPAFAVNPQTSDPHKINYGYTITDALYEIRRERRIELAFEGMRQFDLLRWSAASLFINSRPKGYPFLQSEYPTFTAKLDENGLIDYYKTNLPKGYLFRPAQDYLYSIPQDELTLNPNLKQNPGW